MSKPKIVRHDGYWHVEYPDGTCETYRTFRTAVRVADGWGWERGAERVMEALRGMFPNEPWTQGGTR